MVWTFRKRSIKYALIVTTLLHHCIVVKCTSLEDYTESTPTDNPLVEVAAVFINCELDDNKKYPESEATRFEREELFKHNALRDCNKKLALTVKMTSEPTSLGDEYVPIDHVLEGSSKKRVRLLDPYVLRLRRDLPLQAYKLRLVDTVRGILTMTDESINEKLVEFGKPFKREEWQSERGPEPGRAGPAVARRTCPRLPAALPPPGLYVAAAPERAENTKNCEQNPERSKRQEHEQNVIIEEDMDDKHVPQNLNNVMYRENQQDRFSGRSSDRNSMEHIFQKPHFRSRVKYEQQQSNTRGISVEENTTNKFNKKQVNTDDEEENLNENKKQPGLKSELERRSNDNAIEASEKDFALYEIGNPDLWFKVHVQMFEKLSTTEGNTLWNDISKGELVSVSSLCPEWSGQDMSVQYRPADYVPREEFILPMTSLCLLVPLPGNDVNTIPTNNNSPADNDENYIVVPSQDVMNADKIGNLKSRHANFSSDKDTEKRHKRVVVRVARALWNVMEDNLNIATHGTEKYLTMLHRKPHHAQVALEVRADGNQLVRVGAQIRECDSGLLDLAKAGGGVMVAGPVLIPPRHTRRLRLEMPVHLPQEPQHCSVSLINDKDESVAVRDVVMRRGDRCFCVWHCDCVCYGENTKLPCQEMSEARQAAAGLAPRGYARYARSACYADEMSLNVFVAVTGVILALLSFGLVKGVIGLCVPAVGSWGLQQVLRAPRTLPHYYESKLRGRRVRYDAHGWPVHPDTSQRTVRVLSKPMEFILNILFFVVAPGLITVESVKRVRQRAACAAPDAGQGCSSRDVQRGVLRARRRRDALAKWMTPQADELSANIWETDPTLQMCHGEYNVGTLIEILGWHTPQARKVVEVVLSPQTRPLLCAGAGVAVHSPAGSDSDQDDTAFVLMHMKNSTESLAKSQKKNNATSPSTAKYQNQYQKLSQPDSEIHKH